jgi:ABC-type nitrate/sulfonate/bicarbonate transport system substrate-binding protein
MDQGFFKSEGLDARFVELQGKAQVTAVLSGNLDFAPIPSGGSQAALSGAKINTSSASRSSRNGRSRSARRSTSRRT